MPEANRARVKLLSELARPHSATEPAETAQAIATVRYLPNRSAIGPVMNCIEPWVSASAVMTIEAAPTETAKSEAICGNSVSAARTSAWLAKLASASATIARVVRDG